MAQEKLLKILDPMRTTSVSMAPVMLVRTLRAESSAGWDRTEGPKRNMRCPATSQGWPW